MFYRALSIALVLTPIALAQIASLQGNVMGTDDRPLQGVEIRLEGKEKTERANHHHDRQQWAVFVRRTTHGCL